MKENRALLVLAGMGMMGLMWAFMMADGEILPSVSSVLYMAFMNFLLAMVVLCLKMHSPGCLFLGSTIHLSLSGVAALVTLEVLGPVVQGGAGMLWFVVLFALYLQARSNKLPQSG